MLANQSKRKWRSRNHLCQRFILNKSGHVVVVVPETETEKAFRVNGKVIYPLVASRNE
jgi:hypothetical protein